tara:strand:+ start:6123 stop:6284 length:162 start_codon:yes stop_codon:yes gene_type:complete
MEEVLTLILNLKKHPHPNAEEIEKVLMELMVERDALRDFANRMERGEMVLSPL